jgi:hypothetical protein
MTSVKRMRSVCHSIAHYATSGVSFVHPHVLLACAELGLREFEVNLLDEGPCPASCRGNEPLRSSLRGVRLRLSEILASEGMTVEDLTQATLTFRRAPEALDDLQHYLPGAISRPSWGRG